jgi:hypothetical protein
METMNTNCREMETKLAELLLDPDSVPETIKAHVAGCEGCHKELGELRATMGLLDGWEAPEPNPYFMTRFQARLREEKAAAPAGWWERLRARMKYGQSMHMKPLAAMAMTAMLVLGGGTYLDFYWNQPAEPTKDAAVVHDLQTLDSNAQLLDQLESISDTGPDSDN